MFMSKNIYIIMTQMPRDRNYWAGLRSKEATVVDKTEEEVEREIRSEGS